MRTQSLKKYQKVYIGQLTIPEYNAAKLETRY